MAGLSCTFTDGTFGCPQDDCKQLWRCEIDGTNATIIGNEPGEFIADRNNITRVWMDHAFWPFVTTKLYIDQTGDTDVLFERTTYFKDYQSMRGTSMMKHGILHMVTNKGRQAVRYILERF